MKKSIFMVAATLGLMIGTSAWAQQPQRRDRKGANRPTAEQLAQQKTERMKAKLALTDEQAQEIYVYNLQQVQEMEARRAEMAAKRKAEFERMQAARKAQADKMQRILTPEQFAKWQQMQRRPAPAGRMHTGGKGKGPRRDDMHRRGKPGKPGFRGGRGPADKKNGKGRAAGRGAANDKPEQK